MVIAAKGERWGVERVVARLASVLGVDAGRHVLLLMDASPGTTEFACLGPCSLGGVGADEMSLAQRSQWI